MLVEGPIEEIQPGSELKPYDTFRCGPYRFQFVPPTPDGLGIPVDYATRSAPYEEILDVESLLVQSGAVDAVMRKIPLRETTSFVGGGADVDVPLFGCDLRVAARLTKVPSTGNLKVARAEGARVRLHGSFTPEGEIGVLDRLEIEGWEFVYLPGRPRV